MAINFVVGLPKSVKSHEAIWVIIYRLTKSTHFLPVHINFHMGQFEQLYVKEVMKLHGVPILIVSDINLKFTSNFWKSLHYAVGTK